MKAHSTSLVASLVWLQVAVTTPAAAQGVVTRSPLTRSDLTGAVSWLNVNKSELSPEHYDDWLNRGALASGTFGWYWTDHLKTEIEAGLSGRVARHVYKQVTEGTRQTSIESTYHFATRRIALGQQYQFYRNVWFHPSFTAGVDVTWEEVEQEDDVLSIFDFQTRQSQFLHQSVEHPAHTDVHVRPFTTVGFKAYMTQKAYFRSDLKMVFRNGVDEVLLRFGFGVDF